MNKEENGYDTFEAKVAINPNKLPEHLRLVPEPKHFHKVEGDYKDGLTAIRQFVIFNLQEIPDVIEVECNPLHLTQVVITNNLSSDDLYETMTLTIPCLGVPFKLTGNHELPEDWLILSFNGKSYIFEISGGKNPL